MRETNYKKAALKKRILIVLGILILAGWSGKGAWYYFKYGMMAQDAVIETGNDKYSRFGPDGKWLGYTNPLT